MIPRSFNAGGVEAARAFLEAMRSGSETSVPSNLLADDALSSVAGPEIRITPTGGVTNRWELAVWLWRQLEGQVAERTLLANDGFWTWMAFAMLDTIAPVRDGIRKLGEDARFILDRSGNRRRWYRHLLAGPYLLVRAHSDNPARLRAVLAGAPDTPGELYEQFAGRKEIVTSPAVVDVFSRLYWKAEGATFKRGAAGRGPGSANRYGKLLEQFDVTYDLAKTTADRLYSMMPREFDRFQR